MRATRTQNRITIIFCLTAVALYIYGLLSVDHIPAYIEGIVLPLDFAVGIPLAFYLVVVRPRNLSPLVVIPAIWLGCGLSALALGSPGAGILPQLLYILVPIELAIAIRGLHGISQVFKNAKEKNPDPMAQLRETMLYLVRKERRACMCAAELGVWYYALFSWRKKPYALEGEKAFTYHNAGGYMNMMLGLALAFPVELVGVHILLSQWSVAAAVVISALSVYAAVWLAGDTRARVMRPVAIGDKAVRLECGIQMEASIPFSKIEEVALSDSATQKLSKSELINYGTFYQANVWVIAKKPVVVETLLRRKEVRAIGLSLDDPRNFKELLDSKLNA